MDWSKAKTILIVAFLITNILLGVVLFSSGRQVETTTKEGFIEDVTRLLNKKSIFINTEISREIPSLNTLTVEYETMDSSELNKRYFNGEGIIQPKEHDVISISRNQEYLNITNKKILTYENKDETEKYNDLDEDKAKAIALEFLENKKYDVSDMKLSYINNQNNIYYLKFSKMYKGRYLETAYTDIEVDNRGVKKVDRIWLNCLDEGETLIYTNTAPKAILSLLTMEEIYGKTIKDISLCYYFNPLEHESKDAKKGNTVPGWRVLFQDGYKTIIDNN